MAAKSPDLNQLRIAERDRDAGRSSKRGVLLTLITVVVVAAAVAAVTVGTRAVQVTTAVARAADAGRSATVLNASGYVTPRRRATVAAKITGRVVAMLVEEGMEVEAGQVLARIDDADAQARLASARADVEVARAAIADLEVQLADAVRTQARTMDLRRENVVSVQDLDSAVAQVDSLTARLALAREQVRAAMAAVAVAEQDVENCVVRAPFDGIAVTKAADVGEMVSPISAGGGFTRTGISTIVDMDSLEIEVDVNESYIARVKPGQRVQSALDAYPDWPIPATVRTVIPTADRLRATVKVRISFDQLDPRILPDMGVKVAFLAEESEGGSSARPRVVIPRAAVREDAGKDVVLVVKDGRLERRAVTLGASSGEDVEILAGISEGDEVVTAAAKDVREGQRVAVSR